MKQRFLLILIFACAFMVSTKAQISKDAVWVGGSIGYNQTKSGTDTPYTKSNSFHISPAIGLVVKDNLVVGISLTYGHGKIKNNGSELENKFNDYGAGIFVRKYIPIVNRLYIFGEASANYENIKSESTSAFGQNSRTKVVTKSSIGSLEVIPGISFAVTKKFLLETSLNNLLGVAYTKTEIKNTTSPGNTKPIITKANQFTAGISSGGKVEFNVGFRFLL
ncbi:MULTISPECIES: autotransporter outer membrane beta-barrel domain-containing protein [Niastella]|uniref:Autotransporter outer membrane beta-barrel domain-containing protein n=1 Tax=Niastella soli TaxID=2821487 RepID=A0ABS3YMU3_9BACT|nr:autotransporter outer membrane beta-barrel domain-containing protein [Niastella soli]MBO9199203.1 autotransporter outer membrane beta-barrel domain-containing protein [Niastella soli]